MPPQEAELLNQRLAYAMGADASGWDLTQLLRVPGTPNRKYLEAPVVKVVALRKMRYDPEELCAVLPPLPEGKPKSADRSRKPRQVIQDADLSRLSARIRDLILHGNRGEYKSRSEADFAACVAMFGAGYAEAEVWAVMTNPANGITEKFFEKDRNGERYLALTIGKERALAGPPRIKRYGSVRVGAPRVGGGIAGKVVVGLG
jgi:RepB DNA-primase from phage plasmid